MGVSEAEAVVAGDPAASEEAVVARPTIPVSQVSEEAPEETHRLEPLAAAAAALELEELYSLWEEV